MNTRTSRQSKSIPKIANDRLLVKGGKLVNHDLTFRADIYIENGVIKQVGNDLTVPGGVTTVDALGAYVIPGGIDASTGFKKTFQNGNDVIETADDFYSGSRSAIAGGTTTIIDFMGATTPSQILTEFINRSEEASTSCCDFALHVDITTWDDDVKAAMTSLSADHGVNSYRVFMSDQAQMSDEQLYDIFQHIRSIGAIALIHAENGSIIKKKTIEYRSQNLRDPKYLTEVRCEEVECEAVGRAITIAQQVDCPIFFWNVTSKSALKRISKARRQGLPVYGQIHAVALVQDGSAYRQSSWNKAASCVTWPPLRDDPNIRTTLLNALASGTLQCLSSGHTLYTNLDKAKAGKKDFSKIPPGTNGVYERMMTLWNMAVQPGHIDINEFVNLTSSSAARLFNMYPRKGRIAVGSDADLVLWRQGGERQLSVEAHTLGLTNTDCSNAFEHVESDAGPSVVICRGKVVFGDDQLHVVQSHGMLIPLRPRAPYIYEKMKNRDRFDLNIDNLTIDETVENSTQQQRGGDSFDRNKSADSSSGGRYTRTSGHRAMHQSGWSFSGDQVDDSSPNKSMIRCYKPPGGASQIKLS